MCRDVAGPGLVCVSASHVVHGGGEGEGAFKARLAGVVCFHLGTRHPVFSWDGNTQPHTAKNGRIYRPVYFYIQVCIQACICRIETI